MLLRDLAGGRRPESLAPAQKGTDSFSFGCEAVFSGLIVGPLNFYRFWSLFLSRCCGQLPKEGKPALVLPSNQNDDVCSSSAIRDGSLLNLLGPWNPRWG